MLALEWVSEIKVLMGKKKRKKKKRLLKAREVTMAKRINLL